MSGEDREFRPPEMLCGTSKGEKVSGRLQPHDIGVPGQLLDQFEFQRMARESRVVVRIDREAGLGSYAGEVVVELGLTEAEDERGDQSHPGQGIVLREPDTRQGAFRAGVAASHDDGHGPPHLVDSHLHGLHEDLILEHLHAAHGTQDQKAVHAGGQLHPDLLPHARLMEVLVPIQGCPQRSHDALKRSSK